MLILNIVKKLLCILISPTSLLQFQNKKKDNILNKKILNDNLVKLPIKINFKKSKKINKNLNKTKKNIKSNEKIKLKNKSSNKKKSKQKLKIKKNKSKTKIIKKMISQLNMRKTSKNNLKLNKTKSNLNKTKINLNKINNITKQKKAKIPNIEKLKKEFKEIEISFNKKINKNKKLNKNKKKIKIKKKIKKKIEWNKNLELNLKNINNFHKDLQKNTFTNKSKRLVNSSIFTNRFKDFVKEEYNKWDEIQNYIKEIEKQLQEKSEYKNYENIFNKIDFKMNENKKLLELNLKKRRKKSSINENFLKNNQINNIINKNIKIIDSELDNENFIEEANNLIITDENIKILDEEIKDVSKFNFLKNSEKINEYLFNFILNEVFLDKIYDPQYWIQKFQNEDNLSNEDETIYGIRTNINAINEYLNLLLNFAFKNYIKIIWFNINNYKLENNLLLELKNLKENKINNLNNLEFLNDNCWLNETNDNYFLKKEYFIKLEDKILLKYRNMNIGEDLFTIQKIFHRCIFDAFNNILTEFISSFIFNKKIYFKIFNPKYEIKYKRYVEQEIMNFFYLSKNNLIEISSFWCGIIKDKEDSIMDNVKFMDDNLINQIKEERLNKLLCYDIIESENFWENFDNTKVLVNLNLCIKIENFLIEDLINELNFK